MRITCPNCKAVYSIETFRIPDKGGYTRCVTCQTRFYVEEPPKPQGAGSQRDRIDLPIWVHEQRPKVISFRDNFGRRYWIDRRQAADAIFEEERRGGDRRGRIERRGELDRRCGVERRDKSISEIGLFRSLDLDYMPILDRQGYPVGIAGPGRRSGEERRSGIDRRAFLIL